MMMKDEIEPIEDYTSTDKSGGGETIVLLNSNPSPKLTITKHHHKKVVDSNPVMNHQ